MFAPLKIQHKKISIWPGARSDAPKRSEMELVARGPSAPSRLCMLSTTPAEKARKEATYGTPDHWAAPGRAPWLGARAQISWPVSSPEQQERLGHYACSERPLPPESSPPRRLWSSGLQRLAEEGPFLSGASRGKRVDRGPCGWKASPTGSGSLFLQAATLTSPKTPGTSPIPMSISPGIDLGRLS